MKHHNFLNKSRQKNLSLIPLASCINYIEKINPYANSSISFLQIEENLRDDKLRTLIYELANAIDKNSTTEIKNLKSLYGTSKEFAKANKFLNKKCKEIWNVHDNKTHASMKTAAKPSMTIKTERYVFSNGWNQFLFGWFGHNNELKHREYTFNVPKNWKVLSIKQAKSLQKQMAKRAAMMKKMQQMKK